MDLLDIVVIALVVLALASGWRRGLTWVGLSLLGLVAGLVIGAAVAPPLARRFAGHDPQTQALVGTGIFLAIVSIIQGVGAFIGFHARAATLRTRLAEIDSWLGSLLAAVGVLAGAWYLGITFADSPYVRLDQEIRGSALLRWLDTLAPRPPAFLAEIAKLLQGQSFPNPFAALAPEVLPPVTVPGTPNTPQVIQVAGTVSKVLSFGCGVEAGSSWPLGGDEMVTNAHVVAGAQRVQVQTPKGDTLAATVVLFDPEVDVAVLRVPGLALQPPALTLAGDPARGTQGAVIGYPGGGRETIVPAGVRGIERAEGRDIYGSALVTRSIEVLAAHIIPGDSGGPLVDLQGRVIGLVFAASTVDPNEGYALSMSQIAPDLQAARGRTAPVSTQDCTN